MSRKEIDTQIETPKANASIAYRKYKRKIHLNNTFQNQSNQYKDRNITNYFKVTIQKVFEK